MVRLEEEEEEEDAPAAPVAKFMPVVPAVFSRREEVFYYSLIPFFPILF